MSKRKLKIAVFHLGFFFSGGGEKLVLEEAIGLEKLGHQVTIYAPILDPAHCFPDLIHRCQIKRLFPPLPRNFPLRDFWAIFGAVLFTPFCFWRFLSFDVLLGANQPGPLICFFLSKILKKPYLVYLAQPTRILYPRPIDQETRFGKTEFNLFYLLTKLFYPLVRYLDRISIQKAHLMLANGAYIARILEKIYQKKAILCPAGVHPLRKRVPLEQKWQGKLKISHLQIPRPFLLLTNRHFPQKRFDYALLALSLVLQKVPTLHLVITGEPTSYTDYLRALIRKLQLEDKVIFAGLVSEKELQALYQNALVYLYTSPLEDFGMGVIEAMAAGTPVVAWNKGGPTVTVLDGKTGYLAKPYKVDDFAQKITRLVVERQLNQKMSQQAQEWANQNFAYSIHNRILEQNLLKVVSCAKIKDKWS